ncbi:hypothetical protein OUZ56_027370 [Daphnia magna]|uniref:Uncharacterized protein n=1 Tax=Daphnia magna TaxID=35525 RepID=A0ABQ9ZQH7_9CRUS|nr:hypothetical protein OUZ56_027370 [Daphnia magna]
MTSFATTSHDRSDENDFSGVQSYPLMANEGQSCLTPECAVARHVSFSLAYQEDLQDPLYLELHCSQTGPLVLEVQVPYWILLVFQGHHPYPELLQGHKVLDHF